MGDFKPKQVKPQVSQMRRKLSQWILVPFAGLFALFEVIVIDSTFAYGKPAFGGLQCFGLIILVLGVPAVLLPLKSDRHRYLSRCALGASIVGILVLFRMASIIAERQNAGLPASELAFSPTLIFLAVQVIASIAYVVIAHIRPRPSTTARSTGTQQSTQQGRG